jgi:hypothetical protein
MINLKIEISGEFDSEVTARGFFGFVINDAEGREFHSGSGSTRLERRDERIGAEAMAIRKSAEFVLQNLGDAAIEFLTSKHEVLALNNANSAGGIISEAAEIIAHHGWEVSHTSPRNTVRSRRLAEEARRNFLQEEGN